MAHYTCKSYLGTILTHNIPYKNIHLQLRVISTMNIRFATISNYCYQMVPQDCNDASETTLSFNGTKMKYDKISLSTKEDLNIPYAASLVAQAYLVQM